MRELRDQPVREGDEPGSSAGARWRFRGIPGPPRCRTPVTGGAERGPCGRPTRRVVRRDTPDLDVGVAAPRSPHSRLKVIAERVERHRRSRPQGERLWKAITARQIVNRRPRSS